MTSSSATSSSPSLDPPPPYLRKLIINITANEYGGVGLHDDRHFVRQHILHEQQLHSVIEGKLLKRDYIIGYKTYLEDQHGFNNALMNNSGWMKSFSRLVVVGGREISEEADLMVLPPTAALDQNYTGMIGIYFCRDFDEAHTFLSADRDDTSSIYVLGGRKTFEQAMYRSVHVKYIFWTRVDLRDNEDMLIHDAPDQKLYRKQERSPDTDPEVTIYVPKHPEVQYLDLIQHVLNVGFRKGDRTGTGNIASKHVIMSFDLSNGHFPLFVSRKMPIVNPIAEWIWFLKGSTDVKKLRDMKCNIWNYNSDEKFYAKYPHIQEKNPLRKVDDIGPMYPFTIRFWNLPYTDCNADYAEMMKRPDCKEIGGFDQIARVIHLLRTKPLDRSIMFTTYNPILADDGNIYPCHMGGKLQVEYGKLNMIFDMRSADLILGTPTNIAGYAFLLIVLAHLSGLTPGMLSYTANDVHIYFNLIGGAKKLTKRKQLLSNTEHLMPRIKRVKNYSSIDELDISTYEVENYNPFPGILGLTMAS